MKRILITGATGNVGVEVIHYLSKSKTNSVLYAGVRNITRAKGTLENYPDLHYRMFDFEKESTFSEALDQIDILFLLRPPHISRIERIFRPLLSSAKLNGVEKVVFLSVQGAERSKVIPHNKIERLIIEFQFKYIFVRPSYFMQNLTTTLLSEIANKRSITLPSGKAKFNWIDVKNIGEATAKLILNFDDFQNQSYDITGSENKNFTEVTELLSQILGYNIRFINVNPIRFYFQKRRDGMKSGLAMVMTILHYLPRLQEEPKISDNYQELTGNTPITLKEFIEREEEKLTTSQKSLSHRAD